MMECWFLLIARVPQCNVPNRPNRAGKPQNPAGGVTPWPPAIFRLEKKTPHPCAFIAYGLPLVKFSFKGAPDFVIRLRAVC
jgi:hypothetical protein